MNRLFDLLYSDGMSAPSTEQQTFFDILNWLCQRGWTGMASFATSALSIYAAAATVYPRVADTQLAGILKQSLPIDLLTLDTFIYLEPVRDKRWLVPVVSVKYAHRPTESEVRIRVALMVNADTDPAMKLSGIGCRFETEEGIGKHDYRHAQWFSTFDHVRSRFALLNCPPWLPTSHPAIPVDATGPLALLVAALIAIYGLRHPLVVDLFTTFPLRGTVTMPSINPRSIP
jgi:hypothetical protein